MNLCPGEAWKIIYLGVSYTLISLIQLHQHSHNVINKIKTLNWYCKNDLDSPFISFGDQGVLTFNLYHGASE